MSSKFAWLIQVDGKWIPTDPLLPLTYCKENGIDASSIEAAQIRRWRRIIQVNYNDGSIVIKNKKNFPLLQTERIIMPEDIQPILFQRVYNTKNMLTGEEFQYKVPFLGWVSESEQMRFYAAFDRGEIRIGFDVANTAQTPS